MNAFFMNIEAIAVIGSFILFVLWNMTQCGEGRPKETPTRDTNYTDTLESMTREVVILNWYDRNQISMLLGYPISDQTWKTLLHSQTMMANACNELVYGWARTMVEDDYVTDASMNDSLHLNSPRNEPPEIASPASPVADMIITDVSDQSSIVRNAFRSLKKRTLRLYAGVLSGPETKEELIDLIMEPLYHNMRRVQEQKLKKLSNMLS
jgi:hypothetical protein